METSMSRLLRKSYRISNLLEQLMSSLLGRCLMTLEEAMSKSSRPVTAFDSSYSLLASASCLSSPPAQASLKTGGPPLGALSLNASPARVPQTPAGSVVPHAGHAQNVTLTGPISPLLPPGLVLPTVSAGPLLPANPTGPLLPFAPNEPVAPAQEPPVSAPLVIVSQQSLVETSRLLTSQPGVPTSTSTSADPMFMGKAPTPPDYLIPTKEERVKTTMPLTEMKMFMTERSEAGPSALGGDGEECASDSDLPIHSWKRNLPQTLGNGNFSVAIVSTINDQRNFFVVLEAMKEGKERMNRQFHESGKRQSSPLPTSLVTKGRPVLAKYSTKYYRAIIIEIGLDDVFVYFTEYGNTATVPKTELRVLKRKYTNTPVLAIPCRLTGADSRDLVTSLATAFQRAFPVNKQLAIEPLRLVEDRYGGLGGRVLVELRHHQHPHGLISDPYKTPIPGPSKAASRSRKAALQRKQEEEEDEEPGYSFSSSLLQEVPSGSGLVLKMVGGTPSGSDEESPDTS